MDPKHKRQRIKRLEHGTKLRKQGGKEEINTTEVSKCVGKKEETVMTVENCQREIESGGDDSWEDVTTTSGNDSACEELSPHSNIDSTSDAKSVEFKSGMLNTEVKSEMVQNTEVKSEMVQNTEVKSEMVQNMEVKSEMVQNTEVKSEMVQNTEVRSEVVQITEVKSEMIRSPEEEPVVIQRSELLQNVEAKSEILQSTEAKMGILHADGSSSNNESDNSTEVSKVITNYKLPCTIMQEVAQETLTSKRSTDHSELQDVSEIYFDKSHSDMLVESREGTVNETMELKEKGNIPLVECREKGLEGEIKTGSWNRCGHNEEQGEVEVIQTIGSGSLSEGVAAAIVPEEKHESNT
jgi:hypothetical protein